MKTNYEEYKEKKLNNPEFKLKYLLAKEKINIELLIDSIKDGLEQEKGTRTIKRRLNKLSNYVRQLSL